jgi:beta-1,4-mannosyl-glycoprotein beta-1,4-N-acetylglucosaminyltransferase
MKIIDGFMFYNELNMLEYRLTILDDVVDYFILVESTHTQNGKEKPLFFDENKPRYSRWLHKIIHIVVRDIPYVFPRIDYAKKHQWVNEHHQRNCIARGIEQLTLSNKDIIMISDLDEITDPELLKRVKSGQLEITLQGLDHHFYYYNLNTRNKYITDRARILTFEEYTRLDLPCHSIREMKCPILSPAGWHLSYFGDTEFIQNKIRSIADFGGDETFTDPNHISSKVSSSTDLFNREHWGPEYVLEKIDVKDNPYLPPMYETHLRGFYKSVAVIVNSCMKYHSTTIPILVESAKKANIPLRNLYIVVGEADENKIDTSNGYTVIFTRFVVEGNNGVVYFTQTSHGLQELKQYTHFFYTSDTTVFLEQFWKNIEKHAMTCPTYIKVEETYSKGIGFLNVDWFLKNKKELFSYLANTDKTLLFNYKSGENYPRESQIRSLFPNLFVFLNEDIIFEYKDGIITINGHTFKNTIKRYHVKQYGGIDRLANVYEDPGLIKFQANYDLKSCGGWRLTL